VCVEVSYAALQAYRIVNVELHWEYIYLSCLRLIQRQLQVVIIDLTDVTLSKINGHTHGVILCSKDM
jgi:hypothetical protein